MLVRREEEAEAGVLGPSAGQIGWTAGMTRREGGRVEHRVCDMAVVAVVSERPGGREEGRAV